MLLMTVIQNFFQMNFIGVAEQKYPVKRQYTELTSCSSTTFLSPAYSSSVGQYFLTGRNRPALQISINSPAQQPQQIQYDHQITDHFTQTTVSVHQKMQQRISVSGILGNLLTHLLLAKK
jgi:hypothetical protein